MSNPKYILPMRESDWKPRQMRFVRGFTSKHDGVDWAMLKGTHLIAVENGVIQSVGTDSFGGHWIYLRGDSGRGHLYVHIEYNGRKSRGARVKQGDRIAFSGNSGKSTGPHLHYEMRSDYRKPNSSINPIGILKWPPKNVSKPKPKPKTDNTKEMQNKINELQKEKEEIKNRLTENNEKIKSEYETKLEELNTKYIESKSETEKNKELTEKYRLEIEELQNEIADNKITLDGISIPEDLKNVVYEEIENKLRLALFEKYSNIIDRFIQDKRLKGYIKYGLPLFIGGNLVAIITSTITALNLDIAAFNSLLVAATFIQQEVGLKYGGQDKKIDRSDIDKYIDVV